MLVSPCLERVVLLWRRWYQSGCLTDWVLLLSFAREGTLAELDATAGVGLAFFSGKIVGDSLAGLFASAGGLSLSRRVLIGGGGTAGRL